MGQTSRLIIGNFTIGMAASYKMPAYPASRSRELSWLLQLHYFLAQSGLRQTALKKLEPELGDFFLEHIHHQIIRGRITIGPDN
jgi:hypothetical protein